MTCLSPVCGFETRIFSNQLSAERNGGKNRQPTPPPLLSSPQLLTESETEAVFVNLSGAQESIPSPADRNDNPICVTGPPGYIGWRNRFLGSINVYKCGLGHSEYVKI
jgi:hypothetical protein